MEKQTIKTEDKQLVKPKTKVQRKTEELFVEINGIQINTKDVYEKAKEYFTEKYPKEKIKSIKIYINTNEKAAYYVINEKADEDFKIEL